MSTKRKARRDPGRPLVRHYGLREAAGVIGVPVGTLKTWVHRGLLPRVKMPGLRGRVLLREDDLVEFLESRREPAVSEIQDELRRMEATPPEFRTRSGGRPGS